MQVHGLHKWRPAAHATVSSLHDTRTSVVTCDTQHVFCIARETLYTPADRAGDRVPDVSRPRFVPPELPASAQVDVYSFGVVLWELVTKEQAVRGQLRDALVPSECPQVILRTCAGQIQGHQSTVSRAPLPAGRNNSRSRAQTCDLPSQVTGSGSDLQLRPGPA